METDVITISNGTRGYTKMICGYAFQAIELKSGWISFGSPLGDNKRDKAMFDNLVYYNQKVYCGKTKDKEEIVKRIENFITNYKHKK